MSNLNENAIREAAYYIWQNAGCPSGKDEQFWAMAIEQLSSTKAPCKSSSKCSCSKTASSKAASSKTAAKKTVSKKTSK